MTAAEVKQARKILDITLAELAPVVGISKQYLCEIEKRDSGQTVFPPNLLKRTLDALDTISAQKIETLKQGRAALRDLKKAA